MFTMSCMYLVMRGWKPTESILLFLLAARHMVTASSRVTHMGFSHRTLAPASRASTTSWQWEALAVQMLTTSSFSCSYISLVEL